MQYLFIYLSSKLQLFHTLEEDTIILHIRWKESHKDSQVHIGEDLKNTNSN